ncbi:Xylose isomerase-like TIM barrel [Planctomycetes bacterium Pan216]|uniref:Xylose isomerase-like TIM barrel n=1 Tax=Kolteria novifilia TaxID=2527975 RepID=A0A518B4M8_9BACT|nr:Xylose isomerase-like TIM barrel [Planctomycetes bacterium Pan216]
MEQSRRSFLKAVGVAGVAGMGSALAGPWTRMASAAAPAKGDPSFAGKIKKAVKYGMIGEKIPVEAKFQMLKELGYDGVEPGLRDKVDPKEFRSASDATGITIHGFVNGWGLDDIPQSIDIAHDLGAKTVLVVAGKVTEEAPYDEIYKVSQEKIGAAIPLAEQAGVQLLVENVWNNFLLSPLEMARYIDEFNSPTVGVYFDVGNVVRYGWPEQWVRILGPRTKKLDIKEYSRKIQRDEGLYKGFQVELGEGDCDWPSVRKALAANNYSGWATAEVKGGDRKRLADISQRMDRVLNLG